MKNKEFANGDKIKNTGKDGTWGQGTFVRYLGNGRVEVLPSGCALVTVDPLISEIEKC